MNPEDHLADDWASTACTLARAAMALGHEAKTETDCPLCRALQTWKIMWDYRVATWS